MEERTCGRCPYLALTEAEQDQLRRWGLNASEHVCDLYHRILQHKHDSPDLLPCEECTSNPFGEEVSNEGGRMPVLR